MSSIEWAKALLRRPIRKYGGCFMYVYLIVNNMRPLYFDEIFRRLRYHSISRLPRQCENIIKYFSDFTEGTQTLRAIARNLLVSKVGLTFTIDCSQPYRRCMTSLAFMKSLPSSHWLDQFDGLVWFDKRCEADAGNEMSYGINIENEWFYSPKCLTFEHRVPGMTPLVCRRIQIRALYYFSKYRPRGDLVSLYFWISRPVLRFRPRHKRHWYISNASSDFSKWRK